MRITAIPQLYRHVNRWRQILSVLSKYGLADWIKPFDLGVAKGFFRDPDGELVAAHSREGRIRLALAELGPTFIKFGQILATRPDIAGPELAAELTQLQTAAPADPIEVIRGVIESELGRPISEVFAEFDETPLASASIGQVHAARLHGGESVVVKVQHSGIEDHVRIDLDILQGLAQLAETVPELAAYRPRSTAGEFQRLLLKELDFTRELRNMQRFASDFRDRDDVCIPEAHPEFSTRRMLVMRRLDGIKVSDVDRLRAAGFDLEQVARRGARVFLDMIFLNGFYHADPHPGNLLVMGDGAIGLLDFGMAGQLDRRLREDFEELLIAVSDQEPERLTDVICRVGAVPAELDRGGLGVEVADFVGHYGGQSFEEFDLSGALNEMTDMIRRYHIVLPSGAALLIKVFIMLEGSARRLSSNFNLLEMMAPYRRKMIVRRLSPKRQARRLRRLFVDSERLLESLPRRITDILQQVEAGKFDVHLDHRGLEPSVNRLVFGLVASSFFIGSSLLLAQRVPPLVGQVSILGAFGCIVSVALSMRLLRAINKSGRLDRKEKR